MRTTFGMKQKNPHQTLVYYKYGDDFFPDIKCDIHSAITSSEYSKLRAELEKAAVAEERPLAVVLSYCGKNPLITKLQYHHLISIYFSAVYAWYSKIFGELTTENIPNLKEMLSNLEKRFFKIYGIYKAEGSLGKDGNDISLSLLGDFNDLQNTLKKINREIEFMWKLHIIHLLYLSDKIAEKLTTHPTTTRTKIMFSLTRDIDLIPLKNRNQLSTADTELNGIKVDINHILLFLKAVTVNRAGNENDPPKEENVWKRTLIYLDRRFVEMQKKASTTLPPTIKKINGHPVGEIERKIAALRNMITSLNNRVLEMKKQEKTDASNPDKIHHRLMESFRLLNKCREISNTVLQTYRQIIFEMRTIYYEEFFALSDAIGENHLTAPYTRKIISEIKRSYAKLAKIKNQELVFRERLNDMYQNFIDSKRTVLDYVKRLKNKIYSTVSLQIQCPSGINIYEELKKLDMEIEKFSALLNTFFKKVKKNSVTPDNKKEAKIWAVLFFNFLFRYQMQWDSILGQKTTLEKKGFQSALFSKKTMLPETIIQGSVGLSFWKLRKIAKIADSTVTSNLLKTAGSFFRREESQNPGDEIKNVFKR